MAWSLRALRALALLAGFFLISGAILAVLIGIDVFVAVQVFEGGHAAWFLVKLLGFSLVLTIPIVRGMFALRAGERRGKGEAGLVVTEEEQPALWDDIHDVARLTGTRPPHRVVLTGEVNAAVAERTWLLGLVPGRRRMYIGMPLLVGLTRPRLRAVLAHELGHYSNRDTRLAGLTMRGRDAVLRTIAALSKGAEEGSASQAFMAKVYLAYGKFYMRVSQSVARRQEIAADLAAARAVGRDTTAAALREVPVLHAAFGFYVERYACVGWDAALLPPVGEFYGGFRHILADPGRADELAVLRAELPEEEHSLYDSHPPIAERVRRIEALPADGVPDDPKAEGALTLLRDPVAVLAALEPATLVGGSSSMRRLGWEDLVHSAGRAAHGEAAEPLRRAASADGAAPGLTGILDAIDAGRLWTSLTDRLPRNAEAAKDGDRAARESVRSAVREGLAALVRVELADAGRGRWELSWSDLPRQALTAETAGAMGPALDAAVADLPDTAPLRELLAAEPPASVTRATAPATEPAEAPAAGAVPERD
ncbi:M48 family metalloprotease [Streptomyces sp. NPDC048111]|uniref:M48 family metallopeptidase n=1 Tax=Streptomyces sp. NPDC048111 TaxID=3365500 RepID=UPI003718AA85